MVCGGYTGTPPDRRIEKVSLGAENFIKWEKQENALEYLKKLKEENYQIVALEQTSRSKILFNKDFKLNKNVVLVLGNEVEGVRPELLEIAHLHLEIPMHGEKSSLNVSVAAGIALYNL